MWKGFNYLLRLQSIYDLMDKLRFVLLCFMCFVLWFLPIPQNEIRSAAILLFLREVSCHLVITVQ